MLPNNTTTNNNDNLPKDRWAASLILLLFLCGDDRLPLVQSFDVVGSSIECIAFTVIGGGV